MSDILEGVNWLAVAVGTVLGFLLGWLWYSPKLFGAKWAEGVGLSMDPDKKPEPPAAAMVMQLLGTFLLAWVIGVTAASNALCATVLVVVTLMTLMAGGGLFAQKSTYAILTEVSFVAAMAVVMVIVQAVL